MKKLLLLFSVFLFMICQLMDGFSMWENLAICLFIHFLFDFLLNLGEKIIIMDLAIVMAALTCLLMPVIFYHQYTRENHLARLWVKYMFISSDDYFSFMVPAVVAMSIGLHIPLGNLKINKNPKTYMDNVKGILQQKPTLGLILIGIGLASSLLDFLSPQNLKQVFYLCDHLTYVGAFYIIYSPNKYKKIIVPAVIVLMIAQTLATGMFGDFLFMLLSSVILILLGTRVSFRKKLMIAVAGVFFILIVQSVKFDYRKRIWKELGGGTSDPSYYAQLVAEKITNPSSLLDPDKLFFVAVRMNQGWLIAYTMYNVPNRFAFANGETIWQSVAAAIVPRFLWPDKPEAGGKANLKRFWGFDLVGFSMNIGPLGEAYANFNVFGGIIFMFFYGLFFNLILSLILKYAERRPTVILWVPFLFFYAVGVETDLLTTMGSLVKGLMFTWIVFWIFRSWFRIEL
jgi:hypothetical protein